MTVLLRDVTLRDGLQDEDPIPTEQKLAIFEALAGSGIRELELASFVRPDRVPAMADAEALCAATATSDVIRWGLVLNLRGAQRALDAGLAHLQFVVSISDDHSRDNAGRSTDEAVEALREVCALAGDNVAVEVTFATSFGCPILGPIDPDRVVQVARDAESAGVRSISLADTIGTAMPGEVRDLVTRTSAELSVPVAIHLHDTRGLGIVNALAAYDAGVRRFDASVGALGGCPFAAGASGNVALEDLAHMFEESGIDTGLSIESLIETAGTACAAVGSTVGSHVGIAGRRFATHT